jgi:long-chain acyl-CoA synthetase
MPAWGRHVTEKAVGSYRVRILEPRPTHLTAVLDEARKWGDREFLVFDEQRTTFAQFLDGTLVAAQRLRERGVQPGEVVLLLGANSPGWMLAFWGLVRIGAIVAQGNAWWSAAEVETAVQSIGARVVIADARRRTLTANVAETMDLEAFDDAADGSALAGASTRRQVSTDGNEDDPAVLIFTSGTTGRAKAATLSHRAVVACLHNLYLHRGRLPDELRPSDPQLALFCCNPLFHVGGLLLQAQALLSGHRFVMLKGRATGTTMLELIDRERVNLWSTVPTLLSRVLDEIDATGGAPAHDRSHVVGVSASGSMVSPELMERARRTFPAARMGSGSTYGMTESGGSVTFVAGADYLARPGSAGPAFATCELRIDRPDAGGVGEILIRTPSAMTGYWGEPQSAQIVDAQGWIHSGDLGRLDGDGHLYVTGRAKDIIIRGGENVSAAVIEQALAEHPDVAEAAVVGLPHADLGEEVGAAVVPREGRNVAIADLAAHLSARLAYFQVPSRWWLRDERLPTNAAGKVLKPLLREHWPRGA